MDPLWKPMPVLPGKRYFAITYAHINVIIVENSGSVPTLNELLHEYADYIIGRMGLPYKKRGVSIVSIAIDAPQNVISALTGKIGRLDGVSVKTAYSNVTAYEE